MARRPSDQVAVARLRSVQGKVREMARTSAWFAEQLRTAVPAFQALESEHRAWFDDRDERERQAAEKVLKSGRLFDPRLKSGVSSATVHVEGAFPVGLVEQLRKLRGRAPSTELEEDAAREALAALHLRKEENRQLRAGDESDSPERRAERTAVEAGTHEWFRCRVIVAQPSLVPERLDPSTTDREVLLNLPEEKYRTIALYRLGGLADAGLTRPIVHPPADTGEVVTDATASWNWEARFPVREPDGSAIEPELCPDTFPPALAEEMLEQARAWVGSVAPAERTSSNGEQDSSGPSFVDWAELGARASRLVRDEPKRFRSAADWFRGLGDRPCEPEFKSIKPGEPFHAMVCLQRGWFEVSQPFQDGPDSTRYLQLNDEIARRVVLLAALSADPDFTSAELGLDVPFGRSGEEGEPLDGKYALRWGALDAYSAIAARSVAKLEISNPSGNAPRGHRKPTPGELTPANTEKLVTVLGEAAKALKSNRRTLAGPQTRRGALKLAGASAKDHQVVALLKDGLSYRQAAARCNVGKTTVGRIAQAYDLTGHPPETVPVGGTLSDSLTIRERSRSRGKT